MATINQLAENYLLSLTFLIWNLTFQFILKWHFYVLLIFSASERNSLCFDFGKIELCATSPSTNLDLRFARVGEIDSRGLFHQHVYAQLFCSNIPKAQKRLITCVKCWWNQLQGSRSSYLELEWYGEESNDDIGQGEVSDEVVRYGLHSPARQHDADDQTVAWS